MSRHWKWIAISVAPLAILVLAQPFNDEPSTTDDSYVLTIANSPSVTAVVAQTKSTPSKTAARTVDLPRARPTMGPSEAVPSSGLPTVPVTYSKPIETDPPGPPLSSMEVVQVLEVIDGDTFVIDTGPTTDIVRLIGIDAPETKNPNQSVECFCPESAQRLADLLPVGWTVYLERDVSDRDRYDRLLRYVWIVNRLTGRQTLVNESLVLSGYATVTIFPPTRPENRNCNVLKPPQSCAIGDCGLHAVVHPRRRRQRLSRLSRTARHSAHSPKRRSTTRTIQ